MEEYDNLSTHGVMHVRLKGASWQKYSTIPTGKLLEYPDKTFFELSGNLGLCDSTTESLTT